MTTNYLKRIIPIYLDVKRRTLELSMDNQKTMNKRLSMTLTDLEEFITWLERREKNSTKGLDHTL